MDINLGEPYGIIGAIAQLLIGIGVVGNMFISWRNSRKIEQVHKATNSMKDELVVATQKLGESKGREDERKEARGRAIEERTYKDLNERQ